MLNCCSKCCISTEVIEGSTELEPIHSIKINDPIEEGQVFFIDVQTVACGDSFEIDFCLDDTNTDIALRLAVHTATNSLTRNSRINKKWGLAEAAAPSSFRLPTGINFEVQVFFKVDSIAIAFDNTHVANYGHRLPLNLIRKIKVRGDVKEVFVERKFIVSYPEQRLRKRQGVEPLEAVAGAVGGEPSSTEVKFLPLPYYAPFRKSFFEGGCSLIVTGKVSPNPKTIKVRLQVGHRVSPLPTIAMQMEVRFTEYSAAGSHEPVIVFNTFVNDNWTPEYKCVLENGLRRGGDFDLRITRGGASFHIYMSKKYLHHYPYLICPETVDTCCIDGDIQLLTAGNEGEILKALVSHT